MAPRAGVARFSRAVLLSELRTRQLVGRAARARALGRVRLGGPHPVLGLDDIAVLVDRPLLRIVALHLHDPQRAGYACETSAHGATDRGCLFCPVPAALLVCPARP